MQNFGFGFISNVDLSPAGGGATTTKKKSAVPILTLDAASIWPGNKCVSCVHLAGSLTVPFFEDSLRHDQQLHGEREVGSRRLHQDHRGGLGRMRQIRAKVSTEYKVPLHTTCNTSHLCRLLQEEGGRHGEVRPDHGGRLLRRLLHLAHRIPRELYVRRIKIWAASYLTQLTSSFAEEGPKSTLAGLPTARRTRRR